MDTTNNISVHNALVLFLQKKKKMAWTLKAKTKRTEVEMSPSLNAAGFVSLNAVG